MQIALIFILRIELTFLALIKSKKLEKEKGLNDIFHALSSLPRRKIIELLREFNEMKVGAIAKVFDMSLNGVSKHLKGLERVSLIERHIEGREHTIKLIWQ